MSVRKTSSALHIPPLVIASLCFNLIFFTFIPFNLERSISVFMLSYMDEQDRPLPRAAVRDAFVRLYVDRYGAIDRRLDEQVVSHDVILTPDGYMLTAQGKRMVGLFRTFADIFGVAPKSPAADDRSGAENPPNAVQK